MNKDGPTGNTSQRDRFIEAARELGCDEDEEAFRAKLRVIARQKVKDEPAAAPRGKKSEDR